MSAQTIGACDGRKQADWNGAILLYGGIDFRRLGALRQQRCCWREPLTTGARRQTLSAPKVVETGPPMSSVPAWSAVSVVLTTPFSSNPIWKNDPYARCLTNSVGNSIVAETEFACYPNFSTPAWNELVVYELHVGSLRSSIPVSRNGLGNFDTVIRQLPYLAFAELMPFSCRPAG